MKKIELYNGVSSSVLGFGCGSVLGAIDANTAKRAIECAIDCGITHLDLARSYGYGEAEQFVGKLIKGKRDSLVLVSKFGIEVNWKAYMLKPVKPLFRMLRGKVKPQPKGNASTVIQPVNNAALGIFFNRIVPLRGSDMRKNLERSLKELKTDYLDHYFVHEPFETLTYAEELLATAEELKAAGKIRSFGLAYNQHQYDLHAAYIDKFDIQQFNISPGVEGYVDLKKNRGEKANVFFSVMKGGSAALKPAEKLQTLFNDFPNSVVLVSTFNEKHLKENAMLADKLTV